MKGSSSRGFLEKKEGQNISNVVSKVKTGSEDEAE